MGAGAVVAAGVVMAVAAAAVVVVGGVMVVAVVAVVVATGAQAGHAARSTAEPSRPYY